MTDKDALGAGDLRELVDAIQWTASPENGRCGMTLESDDVELLASYFAALSTPAQPFDAAGVREAYAGLPMSDADLAKHYEASKLDHVSLVGSEVRQIIGELRHYRALPEAPASVEPVVGSGLGTIPDGALDAILGIEQEADNDAEFMAVWFQLEARGYLWSESNVNKAHLGWMLARAVPLYPAFGGGDLREALSNLTRFSQSYLCVGGRDDGDEEFVRWSDILAALPPVKQSVGEG